MGAIVVVVDVDVVVVDVVVVVVDVVVELNSLWSNVVGNTSSACNVGNCPLTWKNLFSNRFAIFYMSKNNYIPIYRTYTLGIE